MSKVTGLFFGVLVKKSSESSITMDELNEIEEKQQENKVRKDSIDTFIDRLKSQETILTDFDEALWTSTINKVVIENGITFYFRDGTEIKEELL